MGTVTYKNKNTGQVVELKTDDSRVGRLERLDNWDKLSAKEAAKDQAPVETTTGPADPVGDTTTPPPGEPPEPVDYSAKSVADLTKIADARNLTGSIEGSGAKGKVVKADLVTALETYDQGLGQRG